MLIDEARALQELAEAVGPDRERHRKSDRRTHAVAAADPVPESEHLVGGDPETLRRVHCRRDRHEMIAGGIRPQRAGEPVPGRPGVRHGLEGGERLRHHDEQCPGRIEVTDHLVELGRIESYEEPHPRTTDGMSHQCLTGQARTQLAPADADGDDGGEPFTGMPPPIAAAHALGELEHPIEFAMHDGYDIVAVHFEQRVPGRTQSHVQRRSMLGGVHVLTGEHRIALRFEPTQSREVEKRVEYLGVDALFRQVHIQVPDRRAESIHPIGIFCEQVPDSPIGGLGGEGRQSPPLGRAFDRFGNLGHLTPSHDSAPPGESRHRPTQR